MSKNKKDQELLVNTLGLRPDDQSEAVYGKVDGYSIIVTPGSDNMIGSDTNYWSMIFAVKKDDKALENDEFKELNKMSKAIFTITAYKNRLVVCISKAIKEDKNKENILNSLKDTINYLKENGYKNCDEVTGQDMPLEATVVEGTYRLLSADSYIAMTEKSKLNQDAKAGKKENVPLGALGALLGSIIGVISIVLISKLGFVAAITGLIMVFCTLKGYQLLGGKLNIKGIIITTVIMIVMIYLADRIIWSLAIMEESGVADLKFTEAFNLVPLLVEQDPPMYYTELTKLYIFAALGAVPTMLSEVRSKKTEVMNYKLG